MSFCFSSTEALTDYYCYSSFIVSSASTSVNNWFAVFTVWVAMAIEFSGILHSTYLIQSFAAWCAGTTIESNDDATSSQATVSIEVVDSEAPVLALDAPAGGTV